MAASYPSATKSFSVKLDGAGQTIFAAHVNDLQDEVVSIENALRTGLAHAILFATDDAYDIGALGANRPRDLYLSGDARIASQLLVAGTGPHGIGVAADTRFGLRIGGAYTASGVGGHDVGTIFGHNLSVQQDAIGSLIFLNGTLTEAGAGTHSDFSALRVAAPTITGGGAALTNAYTVLIDAAPTGATNNFALRVSAGTVLFGGALLETGILSPAQITSNQDNYAPTGITTARILALQTDAARDITGIAAGQLSGRRLILQNVGAQNIVLKNDATSTAANRFITPGGGDFTLNVGDGVEIWYDAGSSRWRVVGV